MKWYSEDLTVPEQPSGAAVRLVGHYGSVEEQLTSHAVRIELEINDGTTTTSNCLYGHTPKGLAHETPTAEEVRVRYRSKLFKVRERVSKTPFGQLSKLKPLS